MGFIDMDKEIKRMMYQLSGNIFVKKIHQYLYLKKILFTLVILKHIQDNIKACQEVHDPQGHVTTITYDPAGNRTGLAYPNGTAVAYTYDTNNRLTQIIHTNSISQILASYTYTLGPTGNRTRIDESNGIVRQYEYDDVYRLTKEQVADPENIETYTSDYTYDAVGNRLSKTHTITGPIDYTYNNADELLMENGVTYTYDLNGNLATKVGATGTTTYVYDYDNRLTSVTAPAGTVTYKYDVDGNRVETSTGSGTVQYLVDTNRQLPQVLAEYASGGVLIASYVYADDLISMTKNGQTYYYHFDGLGSTRLLTNSAGTITDVYNYDAFGNLIAGAGNTENPFLFTGQQYDANIGFYYLRARYYQPTTGRFTALDPFEADPYAPISLHKYLYAGDDPVNKIDPSGEQFDLGSMMVTMSIMSILSTIATPSYAGILKKVVKCDAKMPESPIYEVALTCFAESSNKCSEGNEEKRAITDCVYNRVRSKYRSVWCNKNKDVWDVLACENQFDGFASDEYMRAGYYWMTFGSVDCKKLKDCISAAEASSKVAAYKYNGFNQTYKPDRKKICNHYFRID
jgi:RHS repeat-associated protein